jgi:hypothetical protein
LNALSLGAVWVSPTGSDALMVRSIVPLSIAGALVAFVTHMVPAVAAFVAIIRRPVASSVVGAMMPAMVGMLVPAVVDIAWPRTVLTVCLMPNLRIVRAEIARRVVVVSGVYVPARRHEGIAVPRRNPMTADPHEAHPGVLPMSFHPDRPKARRLRTHDDHSGRGRRRFNDDDPWSRLLDDGDTSAVLCDLIVVLEVGTECYLVRLRQRFTRGCRAQHECGESEHMDHDELHGDSFVSMPPTFGARRRCLEGRTSSRSSSERHLVFTPKHSDLKGLTRR